MTQINCCSVLTIVTHPILPSRTHPPITIQITRFNYLFFPYITIIILTNTNKIPWLFLSYPLLNKYIYDYKTLTYTLPIIWRPYQYYTNPALPTTKYHMLFVTYYPSYTPHTSVIYNIPAFHTLYTTYPALLYIRLLTTPSKLITIHNLHNE